MAKHSLPDDEGGEFPGLQEVCDTFPASLFDFDTVLGAVQHCSTADSDYIIGLLPLQSILPPQPAFLGMKSRQPVVPRVLEHCSFIIPTRKRVP